VRRTLAAAGVVAVLALSAAPVAGDVVDGEAARVGIGYADYHPAKLDVLVGDTVDWHNESVRRHTVTDDAGRFDSGTIPIGGEFAYRFEEAGSFPYHCRIHAGILGEVDAWTVLLDRPSAPAQPGVPFPLQGRAALPSGTRVSIEADRGDGNGFSEVTSSTSAADGSFTAIIEADATASYRAVADGQASPVVQLLVLNHEIAAHVRRGKRSTVVSVQVTPADPGAPAVLQLRLRDRFGWWPVARARLDRNSRARFVLRVRRPVVARVLLTLPDGATALATSERLRVGRRS
jgi:plastocyanin